jgi:histidinol-phosphate aminotransferase
MSSHTLLLDRNENEYGPAPACFEALRTADLALLSHYARTYTRGVKSELSEQLATITGVPEKQILLSYGSEDMLKQVVHCYLRNGRTMLLPRHSWWYYKSLAGEVGGVSLEFPLYDRGDHFAYSAQNIVDLYAAHHPSIILIASPSNPTGNSISPGDLTSVVSKCPDAVIVLDEAYFGFSTVAHDHIRELLNTHSRMVILRTFSKYYALAGLRIGYACVGENLGELVRFGARYLGYNQLTERIALAALASPAYYEKTSRDIREDNLAYFEMFNAFRGFKPYRTDANFILVRHPSGVRERLRALLEERGIVVKFMEEPGLEDCMRITTGTRVQNSRVMAAFRESARLLEGESRTP